MLTISYSAPQPGSLLQSLKHSFFLCACSPDTGTDLIACKQLYRKGNCYMNHLCIDPVLNLVKPGNCDLTGGRASSIRYQGQGEQSKEE